MSLAISIFIALNIADIVSTYFAVEEKGMKELNPIARFMMDRFGTIGGLSAIKLPVVVAMLYLPVPIWLLWASCFLYVLVIINNVYQLWRAA